MAFSKASTDVVLAAQVSNLENAYFAVRGYLFIAPGASSAVASAVFDVTVNTVAKMNDVFQALDLVALDAVSVACTNFAHTTTGTATVTISAAAPHGGVVVDLTSSDVGKATVPATVTVLEGATTATYTVTGVGAGATDLGASIGLDVAVTHTLTLS